MYNKEKNNERKLIAINKFLALKPDFSFVKLGVNQIDFKIINKDKHPVSYVDVMFRDKSLATAYPLPVSATVLIKLCKPRLNPIIIWACYDGIIYGEVKKIVGEFKWGGRSSRIGSLNDGECMAYFPKQNSLKFIRY